MDRIGNLKRDNKQQQQQQQQRAQLKKRKSGKKSALKVVYISSPMKVKTCASNFRSLVQELTGRESDVVKLMDFNNHYHDDNDGFKCVDDYQVVAAAGALYDHHQTVESGVAADSESPTTSSSVSGSGSGSVVFNDQMFDDLITVPEMFDESCDGLLFPAGFLYESSFSEVDFVRNYEFV